MKYNLGQHFLKDKNIAIREVDYAEICDSDTVLEIGPGKGILTKILAEKAKKVVAIELDKDLYNYLEKILPDNVELINADAVDVDLKKINFNKIVSNLPFQISSPITFKFLEKDFEKAVLIYQKDFADRMVAMPGTKNYSNLSVNLYYRSYCEILEIISKNSFDPKPKVDAAIVKIFPINKPPFEVKSEEIFLKLTRLLFNHRRKMIRSVIKDKYPNIKISDLFYKDMRVEKLSPEQIGILSDQIFEKIS